jgi:uncharacterized membrane protein
MHTPFEKIKKADKNLRGISIICLIMGLIIIGDVLCLYLKHDFSNLWGKQLPVSEYELMIKAFLVLVVWVLPSLGVLFLLIGYGIGNYRRKRDAIKGHAKTDT